MKQTSLVIALALVAATFAKPVEMDAEKTGRPTLRLRAENIASEIPADIDTDPDIVLSKNLKTVASRVTHHQENVGKHSETLEENSRSLLAPHVIRKRDTTWEGSHGNGRARVDLNHREGDITYNANLSYGPGGPTVGGGIGLDIGDSNIGGSFQHNDNFGTLGRLEASHSWNDGNTNLGGFYEHGSYSGGSAGIMFSHRF